MPWARGFWLRLQSLFRRKRNAQRLDDEIQFHVDQQIAENIAHGMSPQEACYSATRTFGNPTVLKEETRDTWGWTWLEQIVQDLRYGARALAKNSGVTAIVVITLALGIGVNTAMFSLLNGWLLRPLPVPLPEQITVLASQQKEGSNGNFSYPDFLDFQRGDDSFSSLCGYSFGIGGLSTDGDAREIAYSSVTGNYFSALGVKPALGRLFLPGEGEKPGEELLVVLGYTFWQRKFGGDPHVIGKSSHKRRRRCRFGSSGRIWRKRSIRFRETTGSMEAGIWRINSPTKGSCRASADYFCSISSVIRI